MKSSLAHEYENFWEKNLRIIKDECVMVVGALLNRVFEGALTSTIVSDFLWPVNIVGAGIKICPCLSVCLSVRPFVTLYNIEFV